MNKKVLSAAKGFNNIQSRRLTHFLAMTAIFIVSSYVSLTVAFAQNLPAGANLPNTAGNPGAPLSGGANVPAAGGPTSPAPNPPVGVTAPAPVGGASGGSPTIYTGPGFVNVTPFSTFGRVSIDRIINNVINYISGFLATIAVLSLMYGGVLYMTAGGDNGKIGKAKQVIVLTIVGLIIGSFAYMIIIFTTRLFYGS